MLNKLYFWLGHWLMDSLPKVDDNHIKCATCGWESEHINNLKFIYVGYNTDDWRNSAVDRGCEDY